MVERPFKELRGFEKVNLMPKESKRIEFSLDYRDFAYYNTALDKWHVENGDFEIMIGTSSKDIRLISKINLNLSWEEQFSLTV